ncbi:VIR protein [Plasmodium vivax]|uniref:VIR protein n=1 Tax=Plasmodium vivax TaxID=5855 RepID=A0A1G4GSI8_PLAVI|nr:VIR protein [Plasmodium vivax]
MEDDEDSLVFPDIETTFDKYKHLLDDLPLFKYYKHLDEDLRSYNNACAEFPQKSDAHIHLTDICKKLVRNLHNISQNDSYNNIDKNKRCKYLKYWLYDYILTYNTPNNDWILNEKWQNELEKRGDIDCEFESCYKNKDFHIMDIIVDFYEYYNRNDDKEHVEKQNARRGFIQFFKENYKIYKSMEKKCLNQKEPVELCKKFHECDKKCRSFLSTIEPIVKEQLEVEAKSYNVLDQLKQTFEVLIDKASSNIGSSIGVSAGSMAGISFISLILYKFTPFGSFVRPFIPKKIGNFNYLEGEIENLAHSHQMMELYSNKRRYNFAYHSATNS